MVGGVVSTFHAKGLKMISSPPGTGGPSSKLKGVGMQTPHVAWNLSRVGLTPLHAVCVTGCVVLRCSTFCVFGVSGEPLCPQSPPAEEDHWAVS